MVRGGGVNPIVLLLRICNFRLDFWRRPGRHWHGHPATNMSESNPSHSRTSSVASVLMLTRWFLRTQLWVWPLVAALVLVFIGVWLRVKMEGATKQQIADTLQTILNANTEALRAWSVTMKSEAEDIAEDDLSLIHI